MLFGTTRSRTKNRGSLPQRGLKGSSEGDVKFRRIGRLHKVEEKSESAGERIVTSWQLLDKRRDKNKLLSKKKSRGRRTANDPRSREARELL